MDERAWRGHFRLLEKTPGTFSFSNLREMAPDTFIPHLYSSAPVDPFVHLSSLPFIQEMGPDTCISAPNS